MMNEKLSIACGVAFMVAILSITIGNKAMAVVLVVSFLTSAVSTIISDIKESKRISGKGNIDYSSFAEPTIKDVINNLEEITKRTNKELSKTEDETKINEILNRLHCMLNVVSKSIRDYTTVKDDEYQKKLEEKYVGKWVKVKNPNGDMLYIKVSRIACKHLEKDYFIGSSLRSDEYGIRKESDSWIEIPSDPELIDIFRLEEDFLIDITPLVETLIHRLKK